MDTPSENPQVAEYRAQGRAVAEEERVTFADLGDDFLLECCATGESGDAKLVNIMYRDRFVKDRARETWVSFYEHNWKDCELDEPLAELDGVIEVYGGLAQKWSWRKMAATKAGSEKEAKKAENVESMILKKISLLQRRRHRENVLFMASVGIGSLGRTGSEWDSNHIVVPFRNGLFELQPRIFRPTRPDDYVKTFCPVDWLGFDTPCPKWEKFMADIMAMDMEMVGYIKRLLGSSISGRIIEHVLPIFWGERGRNGKTVLLEVLGYCMGGMAGPVDGQLLLADKYPRSSAAPSPDRMAMRGKRLLWASEIDEGVRLAAGRVKSLTGGDTIIARGPFDKREIRFQPTHQLLLLTNFRPKVNADDAALWQRIHLVEFPISFVDDPVGDMQKPRNPHIASELKEEAAGIMAWLVAGYYEWIEKGLAPPPPVLGATQKYRISEDWMAQFIEDCCVIQEGTFCKGGEIYEVYKSWCKENGTKPQRKKFYEKLKAQFDSVKTESGRLYGGIGLLEADGTDTMTAKSL